MRVQTSSTRGDWCLYGDARSDCPPKHSQPNVLPAGLTAAVASRAKNSDGYGNTEQPWGGRPHGGVRAGGRSAPWPPHALRQLRRPGGQAHHLGGGGGAAAGAAGAAGIAGGAHPCVSHPSRRAPTRTAISFASAYTRWKACITGTEIRRGRNHRHGAFARVGSAGAGALGRTVSTDGDRISRQPHGQGRRLQRAVKAEVRHDRLQTCRESRSTLPEETTLV